MTAILREEPPELPRAVACPPALQRILRHCLEKDPAERFQSARDLVFNLEAELDPAASPAAAVRPTAFANRRVLALLAAGALGLAAVGGFVIGRRSGGRHSRATASAGIHRLTDFSGLEEFPAIAPDLKSVAFTARVNGSRQIFVRLVAGGTPLQITKDAARPRAAALVARRELGDLLLARSAGRHPGHDLGDSCARRRATAGHRQRRRRRHRTRTAGSPASDWPADRSSWSRRHRTVPMCARSRDSTEPVYYKYPRWSPDSKWIAYQRGDGVRWDIFAVPLGGGPPRQLTHDNGRSMDWRGCPTARGVIYSSSRGTSMPYLPTQGLWEVDLDGGAPRRDRSPPTSPICTPTSVSDGMMVASRLQMQFDLWKYPTDGRPEDNVRRGQRITRQTARCKHRRSAPATARSPFSPTAAAMRTSGC